MMSGTRIPLEGSGAAAQDVNAEGPLVEGILRRAAEMIAEGIASRVSEAKTVEEALFATLSSEFEERVFDLAWRVLSCEVGGRVDWSRFQVERDA